MSNSWTGKKFFAQWNQSTFFWLRWTNHGMTWQSRNLRTLRFSMASMMPKGQASMMPRPQEPSRTHSGFEAYYHFEWAQFWFSHVWLSRRLDCVAVELVLCLLRRWLKRWLKSRSTISAKPGLVPVKTPTSETTPTQQWTDGLLWKAGSPVLELGSTDATATRGIMATFFCLHSLLSLLCRLGLWRSNSVWQPFVLLHGSARRIRLCTTVCSLFEV